MMDAHTADRAVVMAAYLERRGHVAAVLQQTE